RLAGGHRRRHLCAARDAPGAPGRGVRARRERRSAPLPAERPPRLRGERGDLGRRLSRWVAGLGRVLPAPLGDGGGRLRSRGVVHARGRAPGSPRAGWSLGRELYLGRVEQPQWLGGRVDAKMFLYLLGAVSLELNLLSFGAHHFLLYPTDP